MSCWTEETGKIIRAHEADFDSFNCTERLKAAGGYKEYLNKLGGVFAKYNGHNASVRTAGQFQEVAQYVFGLMAIYGFNYNNDTTTARWGGGYPFYPSKDDGKCNWGEIDTLCCYASRSKTTNCNYGMDSLYYKAGLAPKLFDYSYRFKWFGRNYPVIRDKKNLRIGDLVHFFHKPVKSDNPDKWEGWGHVACVGEIHGTKVVLYDSGSRFIKTGDFKKVFTVDSNNKPTGLYDNYEGWAAVHIFDLVGGNGEVKGDSDLAVEVIAGKYGNDKERQRKLGNRYVDVQSRVNYFVGGTKTGRDAYLRAAAGYVLKGFAGKDKDREIFFGKNYPAVQDKVNWTIKTAKRVINGEFGNDEERKSALGIDYNLVQQQVNRMV